MSKCKIMKSFSTYYIQGDFPEESEYIIKIATKENRLDTITSLQTIDSDIGYKIKIAKIFLRTNKMLLTSQDPEIKKQIKTKFNKDVFNIIKKNENFNRNDSAFIMQLLKNINDDLNSFNKIDYIEVINQNSKNQNYKKITSIKLFPFYKK